jgi:RHS repeat-associated protein
MWTAGYDAACRLTNVLANQAGTNLVSTTYTYDAADNRLVEDVGGVPAESYFNALNQLVSMPSASPTNTTYEWDGARRLTAIAQGAARSEFAYDGWGRLCIVTEKSGGSIISQRRFVWCGPQICEELDSNNSVVNRFFYAGEQRQGTNYYYFSDHLGSVREFVDAASALRAEYSYSPFGTATRRQGDLDSNFGFTYLLNHQPTATMFATYRVYDPSSARWLSRDPLGESAGLNVYAYVRDNPIARKDPLGLDDGLSSSPGGLGPQLNLNFGNLSAQLQAPWSYPGSNYSLFDLTLNLNLTKDVALLCDLSIGGAGIDVKNVGPFEFQTTFTGLKTGQEQITIDTGNPKVGLQFQGNRGPDGTAFTLGVGGTFP